MERKGQELSIKSFIQSLTSVYGQVKNVYVGLNGADTIKGDKEKR